MIRGLPALALIPARGGSKGLPRKNVLPLDGKPMIAWTVEAALNAACIDRVVVSTDDPEIAEAARAAGAETPFVRPAALASDEASSLSVIEHALDALDWGAGALALLQPTSPLRIASDIDAAASLLEKQRATFCVSVVPNGKPLEWLHRIDGASRLQPVADANRIAAEAVSRRQDAGPVYALNGALYLGAASDVRRARGFIANDTVAYVMPRERSIDIDDAIDLEVARSFITAGRQGRD